MNHQHTTEPTAEQKQILDSFLLRMKVGGLTPHEHNMARDISALAILKCEELEALPVLERGRIISAIRNTVRYSAMVESIEILSRILADDDKQPKHLQIDPDGHMARLLLLHLDHIETRLKAAGKIVADFATTLLDNLNKETQP